MTIAPYYLKKSEDVLRDMRFDGDADPRPLAEWAQDAAGDEFVFAVSDGAVVGHGRLVREGFVVTARADRDTIARYGLLCGEAGMACGELAGVLGRPVVIVKASRFSGPSRRDR